ncbi:heterokaryon incompatibility protein-domain-containing protein [Pyronema domesticum]|nr:heterokaryon incompatibility protein-domain-containing protein [Pyronema domesticum]
MDDLHISLNEIDTWPDDGESRGRLLHSIEEAQKHMVPGWKSRRWAHRLRFLVDFREDSTTTADFKIITDDIDSPDPYIAVSYCWSAQSDYSTEETSFVMQDIGNGNTTVLRPNRARPEVLIRSFQYAAVHGIRKIWIDQECIDQNDPIDKEMGIQSMDLVYRRADVTLVLLGQHIETLKEAERVLILSDKSGRRLRVNPPPGYHYKYAGDYPESMKLPDDEFDDLTAAFSSVGRIAGDKWFTRAWTTQEFILSDENNFVFLLGWKNGKDQTTTSNELSKWERFFLGGYQHRTYPYSLTRKDYIPKLVDAERIRENVSRQVIPGEWILEETEVMAMLTNLADLTKEVFAKEEPRLIKPPYNIKKETDLVPWIETMKFLRPMGKNVFARDNRRYDRDCFSVISDLDISNLEWPGDKISSNGNTRDQRTTTTHTNGSNPASKTSLTSPYYDVCIVPAIEHLHGKGLLFPTDKLAIMGNITEYRWRINTVAIRDSGISLSACVLALALYNGDTSLLFAFGYPFVGFTRSGGFDGRGSNRTLPEWLPDEFASLEISNRTHVKHRAKPMRGRRAVVVDGRLFIYGLLWHIQPFHWLSTIKDELTAIHKEYQERKELGNHSRCFKPIVRRLLELGRRDLVEVIMNMIDAPMPRDFSSPVDIFALVSELEEWYAGRIPWPLEEDAKFHFSSFLCNQIFEDRPLSIGYAWIAGSEKIPITAIFEADPNIGRVFTPSNHLAYEFQLPDKKRKTEYCFSLPLLSWAVSPETEEKLSMETYQVAESKLTVSEDLLEPEETPKISKVPLKVKEPMHILGWWSPRLCESGLLMPIEESKSWRLALLDSMYYSLS